MADEGFTVRPGGSKILLCRSSASALPSESSFCGMWTWNSRPVGLSARLVVGLAEIVGLKSTWSQPLIAGASKGAADVF